jgi:hypothetical protein
MFDGMFLISEQNYFTWKTFFSSCEESVKRGHDAIVL